MSRVYEEAAQLMYSDLFNVTKEDIWKPDKANEKMFNSISL